MGRNRLSELNGHLFAQLERLSAKDLAGDALAEEVKRAAAVVSVAASITANADTQLKAARLFAEHGAAVLPMLPRVGPPDGKDDE